MASAFWFNLNRRASMIAKGDYRGPVVDDSIPCGDAAGEIVAIDEGVTAFTLGDQVLNPFHPR